MVLPTIRANFAKRDENDELPLTALLVDEAAREAIKVGDKFRLEDDDVAVSAHVQKRNGKLVAHIIWDRVKFKQNFSLRQG